ncbi:transient receptor potential cation channel subfamily A member 1-like [Dysidea avara]|uniref:transient receptor potential cation channel subfamily A member 1-like n=1 Tax=Dysidea avara TaxID=196820 RepID=UPI003333F06B
MDTAPTLQTQADSNYAGCAGDSTNSLQPTRQSDEEGEDVGELEGGNIGRESQPVEPKIDVNVLKNEILVDGMQAAADGDVETLQELILKFGKVQIPHDTLINMHNLLGYTMLHYAVMYKRMNCIEALIELGADIERTTNNETRDTPLLLAIKFLNLFPPSYEEEDEKVLNENKMEVVRFLIAQGCKVHYTNKANESPIVLATKLQNVELVEELVKRRELDVNTRNHHGKTPLHMVAATGNDEIALVLLRHGADVQLKDTGGSTPLHIACYRGNTSIVELIFKERPQSRDVLLTQADRAGNIPLMIAKKSPNNSTAIINFLISHDVDLQSTNEMSETLLHMFGPTDNAESTMLIVKRAPSLLSSRNIYRQTPLHIAAMMGHKESLLVFIRSGADITARDNNEMIPLMLAIQAEKAEIISVMLNLGLDIHAEATNDKSIIEWAIEKEYTSLVKALIERGQEAATQFVDDEENTFLHVAAKSGSLRTIHVLLSSSVTEGLVRSQNKDYRTPLHIAAQYGNLQCLKELLDGGADVTKVDKDNNNILHIACIYGQLNTVQFLLQSGLISPELSNGKLGTPLSCAAYHGHDHIVSCLLGRDVSCNGSYADLKVSPLLLATQQGHIKVVKVLLEYPRIDVTLTNEAGHNALAEAIVKGYKEVALEIITSDHRDKAMRMCTKDNMTPMRLLIMHMPDLAKVIMDKCIVANEGASGVTHITYNYEFIDDFDDPKLGTVGKFMLEKVLPFKSKQRQDDVSLVVMNKQVQNDLFESEQPSSSFEYSSSWKPRVYDKSNHTLALMVESERIELLQHPLVTELMNHKWNRITLPSFLLQTGLYTVFLGFLTSYVLLLPNPRGSICRRRNLTEDCPELSTRKTEFLFAATIILLLFSVLNLIVEGLQALSRRLDYLKEWDNYMQLTIPALTITFVISNKLHDCFCPSGPQWQLGSLVIFLAWFNFILLMRSVPFTAIPINMLFGITRSFLKVIVLPVLLITSFGIPLFLLLHQPGEHDPFETIFTTFLKSLTMTTGELEFVDNFIERDVFYPFVYYFWIVFVIIMPVLFNNLLVGLAVGDTREELQKANLTKLALQISSVLELEERLPSVRLYFSEKSRVVTRNHRNLSKIPFLQSSSFDSKVKAINESNETNSNLMEEYQKKNPLVEIREELKQHKNEMHLLREFVVKAIENLPLQLGKLSNSAMVATKVTKNEMICDENTEIMDNQGLELPLPVPDLL